MKEIWDRFDREDPRRLREFESFWRTVVAELNQTKSYTKSLSYILRKRVAEHDEHVTTLYDEYEDQVKKERDRLVAEFKEREVCKQHQLQQELEDREMEQAELRSKVRLLESRESELRKMVDRQEQKAEQMRLEKEMLEAKLDGKCVTEEEYIALRKRIGSITQELANHQTSSAIELGCVEAERDALKIELLNTKFSNRKILDNSFYNSPVEF